MYGQCVNAEAYCYGDNDNSGIRWIMADGSRRVFNATSTGIRYRAYDSEGTAVCDWSISAS